MKLNKLLAALLSLSMTTMTFASSPVSIYAEDTASADILNIRFLDMRTGDPVEGINARIERRNYTQFYNEYSKYNQYSDVEVIAESVDNEIVVNKSSLKLYDVVVVDELPDGYTFQTNYDGATYIEQPLVDTFDRLPIKKGSNELDFLLEKDQSKYDRYPIEGECTMYLNIFDQLGYCIEDLDCVLFDVDTGKEYASWTTTDDGQKIENVPYYYGKQRGTDQRLAVRINNMPENLSFIYDCSSFLNKNEVMVAPMNTSEFEHNPSYYHCSIFMSDENAVEPTTAPEDDPEPEREPVPENGFRLIYHASRQLTYDEIRAGVDFKDVKDVNLHLDRQLVKNGEWSTYIALGEVEHLADWNTSEVDSIPKFV